MFAEALEGQPLPGVAPPTAAVPASLPRHASPWTTFFPDPGAEEERSPWKLTLKQTIAPRLEGLAKRLESPDGACLGSMRAA
jgi:hypothetical protein